MLSASGTACSPEDPGSIPSRAAASGQRIPPRLLAVVDSAHTLFIDIYTVKTPPHVK